MDNPKKLATWGTQDTGQRLEKPEGAIKNGQSRETGNIEYTRHRTKVREKRRAIKNGQSKETGNIEYTRHRTKVRENQRGNQEWTIQRHWQHWVHKTQDKG
jgi:hypothetical protein